MTQQCSLCKKKLDRPLTDNANYVVSDRFAQPEPVEVSYVMIHTEETEAMLDKLNEEIPEKDRQTLAAEAAHPDADDTIEVSDGEVTVEEDHGETRTVRFKEIDFSIDATKFKHAEVESPDVIDEDDAALVYSRVEERDVAKTGLVCGNCTEDEDEIIWGIDG